MKSITGINETVISNALLAIFERMDGIEKALSVLAKHHLDTVRPDLRDADMADNEGALLLEKLGRLTLKRHAVLTATLGGQSYQQIAKLMNCDVTTVKLHLKAALSKLDVRSRSDLLATHSDLLACISEAVYQQHFGISKQWWLEENAPLLKVLRTVKPGNNQHSKA